MRHRIDRIFTRDMLRDWDEGKHPRGKGGRFTKSGSGNYPDDAPVNTVGAASPRNPSVINPETGLQMDYVKGRSPEVPKDHTMAGYKCPSGREIDDIDRLVEVYNAPAEKWQKEKARYWVYDSNGEERKVELHWYQHEEVGKVEFKVKMQDGGSVYVTD